MRIIIPFPCPCNAPSIPYHHAARSALLRRARLLKLSFQLHREIIARVVVVPALLPQMRGTGL
jgi:hypothetical protein